MAVELILGCRLDGCLKRVKIQNVELLSSVDDLRKRVSAMLSVKDSEYELIYAGRRLADGRSLDNYGIKAGVTLHVIKRQTKAHVEPAEPYDSSSVPMMLTALQAALLNPAHRHLVTKILTCRETLENVVAATPGLHDDVIAQALLQTPELLINLANPDDAEAILERHPCLAQAAMMIAAVVSEEASRGGVRIHAPGAGSYSLDQMSDEDDYEVNEPRQQQHLQLQQQQAITANQVAAALASANGAPAAPTASGSNQGLITNDYFRQAMQQAMGNVGLGGPASTAGPTGSDVPLSSSMLESQLQQLREMGITDDAAARQALQVAGGNVQMALSILFGDMNEMV